MRMYHLSCIYLAVLGSTFICDDKSEGCVHAHTVLLIDEKVRELIGSGSNGAVYKQYARWNDHVKYQNDIDRM